MYSNMLVESEDGDVDSRAIIEILMLTLLMNADLVGVCP